MKDYSMYEKCLLNELNKYVVLAVVCILFLSIAFFIGKYIHAERLYYIVFIILTIILIIVLIFLITPYILDISQDAYITYSGEVIVREVYTRGAVYRADIVLKDSSFDSTQFNIRCDRKIEEGEYSVIFIYSKYTHTIFCWE